MFPHQCNYDFHYCLCFSHSGSRHQPVTRLACHRLPSCAFGDSPGQAFPTRKSWKLVGNLTILLIVPRFLYGDSNRKLRK